MLLWTSLCGYAHVVEFLKDRFPEAEFLGQKMSIFQVWEFLLTLNFKCFSQIMALWIVIHIVYWHFSLCQGHRAGPMFWKFCWSSRFSGHLELWPARLLAATTRTGSLIHPICGHCHPCCSWLPVQGRHTGEDCMSGGQNHWEWTLYEAS